jgi:hypothetical protein
VQHSMLITAHKHYANHIIYKTEVSQKQWFSFISKINKINYIFKTFKNSKHLPLAGWGISSSNWCKMNQHIIMRLQINFNVQDSIPQNSLGSLLDETTKAWWYYYYFFSFYQVLKCLAHVSFLIDPYIEC